MPAIEQTVEFEAFCEQCKDGICNSFSYRSSYGRGAHQFTVEPCDRCLKSVEEEGYDKGYRDGYDEARREYECSLAHVEDAEVKG